MAEPDAVPLSDLPAEEKRRRAASFGTAAEQYDRFRPGPPDEAVSWILPAGARRVVDLGAGTGALSRVLVAGGIPEVIAVEPDDRMRAVLAAEMPGVEAVAGRGEDLPLPDASVDAVIASSSWHWMDPVATVAEVARVLVPGGTLGAVWSGPDPEGALATQARELLGGGGAVGGSGAAGGDGSTESELASFIGSDASRPIPELVVSEGSGFEPVEHEDVVWSMPLTSAELIGLFGTFSWMLLMPEDRRTRVLDEVRRLLRDVMGLSGDATIDVDFRAKAYRTRLLTS